MSSQRIGQGSLELPGSEQAPVPVSFDPEKMVAVSSMIISIASIRDLDPGMVTDRDVRVLKPSVIESGLYVANGIRDIDQEHARNGVIFPAEEFKFMTMSPLHVARSAATGVWNKRKDANNKQEAQIIANRASGHALSSMLERSRNLENAIANQEHAIKTIAKELSPSSGPAFYAHHRAADLKILLASAETAVFDALNVSAVTYQWDEEKYTRAKRTLEYQLFGKHEGRYKNWKAYAPMVTKYARARRLIVKQSQGPIVQELEKYQAYTDDET